jgi:uncharacterized Zn finger protein (UPF0148 family)
MESGESNNADGKYIADEVDATERTDQHCPVCGAALIQEKCKVVCRSPQCTYRIIFNCSEF